jgi:hypothetical protein
MSEERKELSVRVQTSLWFQLPERWAEEKRIAEQR